MLCVATLLPLTEAAAILVLFCDLTTVILMLLIV